MRKKVLFTLFALVIFANADAKVLTITKGKVSYVLEDRMAYIIGFDEEATKITIESEITYKKQTYKVAGVKSDDSFANRARMNSSVREMVFAEGVTQVFKEIATNMKMLEKVVLPSTVTSIGRQAFWRCESLKEINIPSKVKTIEGMAFARCTSLQTLELPDGLQEIGSAAFSSCTSLKKISLPQSLVSIGEQCFYKCSSLQEMVIPHTVKRVGAHAFSGCSALTTAIILCDMKEIPESFFSGCESLESIVVPNTVRLVGVQAFKGCSSLKEIILPDNAKYRTDDNAAKIMGNKIYKGSFYGCESLTNIKCYNGSLPADIMTYIPSSCPFAKNGGKCENPDFVTELLLSVTNYDNSPTPKIRIHQAEEHVVKSDVDISIPEIKTNNENTFAIIIGNENYKYVDSVIFARHDADIFAEYCMKTLGLPQKNVRVIHNATYAEMVKAITSLGERLKNKKDETNVVFFYAGHGLPDEKTHDTFLLPVDADGSITKVCFAVSELYENLMELKANRVLVFLDACFSGAQRGGGLLQPLAKGVAISPKEAKPVGNMIVFSAASGDETAYPYVEKSHGVFTYYLLKKNKDTRGNVTLGELADYIKMNVSGTKNAENKKIQHPTVSPSSSMDSTWKEMKLN